MPEAQTRRMLHEILAGQLDRDARLLEDLVSRQIEAAFRHRALEERAAYGD